MNESTSRSGLSDAEVQARLLRHGHNELPDPARRNGWRIALDVVREPMFLLLIAAAGIYLLLGEPNDAAMLFGFVTIAMSMTIFQERRSERVLESLRELSSPRALVLRAGGYLRIPGRELVVDDLLVLEEGDRVAADARLLESHDLLLDESLLTGESLTVDKHPQAADPHVYSGTMVVRGNGLARVIATGAATEIGKIGRRLAEIEPERSPLQREISTLVRRFAIGGIALSLSVALVFALTRDDWLGGLLAGIALAMSVLPQEFAVIMAVFMGLGALRMSRHRVLTRRSPVIETLGAATVLCVDKTGTLTQNRMSVETIVTPAGAIDARPQALPADALVVLALAVLASETEPFDPMEKALHRHAGERAPQAPARLAPASGLTSIVAAAVTAVFDKAAGANAGINITSPSTPSKPPALTLLHEYALTPDIAAMAHCWQIAGQDNFLVAAKGAPESVARLCGLHPHQTAAILEEVEQLASRGLRVLAVAHAISESRQWPAALDGFAFAWQGLVAFADPLRPEVPAAVADCHRAGLRVIMITGDYPATALSIARQAGIPSQRVVTGAELAAMDEQALRAAVREVHVYARIKPEQKLRLVLALRALGEVVAMTGDGINDAPALKAAHIGISMGQRGTDVAREASSLVLLEDDFGAIVQALRMGRRIYDNLRKAMAYVIAAHLPIAGMALLPLLAGAPLALLPAHIVFLELIIDPACAIVFENEPGEQDLMTRAPRPHGVALIAWDSMQLALVGGGLVLLAVAAVFFGALAAGIGEAAARGLAFVSIVLGNLGLIVVNRSRTVGLLTLLRRQNGAQWWVVGGALASLLLVFQNDWLRRAFRFDMPGASSLALAALATLAAIMAAEAFKRLVPSGAAR